MKNKIVIAIILVLLLPVIAYLALFVYGTYLIESVKMQQRAVDRKMESLKENDNGFGGESGLKVLDSGYYTSSHYWLDQSHVIFVREWLAGEDKYANANFVWDVQDNNIKPIELYGRLLCLRDGEIYFQSDSTEFPQAATNSSEGGIYLAKIAELDSKWILNDVVNSKDLISPPSDRYRFEWKQNCGYWYRLKREEQSLNEVPEHRFDYFHEWGWILRTPSLGQEGKQHIPEMGIFDIDKAIYSGQPGVKLADLPPVHDSEINDIQIQYLEYLDKFWLAVYSAEQPEINKSMFLVNRKGEYQEIPWLIKGWKKYNELPLLSRKGLVWEGYDYRLAKTSVYDLAGFIDHGGVHKFVHGNVETMKLSPDGCKVAFSSRFRIDKGPAPSLKVFNICESTINGKELNDVYY